MTDEQRRQFLALLDDADRWAGRYLGTPGLTAAETATAYSLRGYIAHCRLYAAEPRATTTECDRHQSKVQRMSMELHLQWLRSGRRFLPP